MVCCVRVSSGLVKTQGFLYFLPTHLLLLDFGWTGAQAMQINNWSPIFSWVARRWVSHAVWRVKSIWPLKVTHFNIHRIFQQVLSMHPSTLRASLQYDKLIFLNMTSPIATLYIGIATCIWISYCQYSMKLINCTLMFWIKIVDCQALP